jgi:flagellar biosynthesis protein FliR
VTDFAPIARFALLLVRPAMIVTVAPVLGGQYAPPQVKVALAVLLALTLAPSAPVPVGEVSLTMMVAREMAIGLALGFVVHALIVGVEFAGHLAGHQIGFSYGATMDPVAGVRNSTVSMLYGMVATVTFLGLNGHHAVLRALAASYERLPIGSGHLNASLVDGVRQTLALVFTLGVRLAAPVIFVLIVVEVVVGLISRTAPSLNFMSVGQGIRIIAGLVVMSLVIGAIPGITASLLDSALALGLRTAASFR